MDEQLAIYAISQRGAQLAARLKASLGGDVFAPERFVANPGQDAQPFDDGSISVTLQSRFRAYRKAVLIMPVGSAVRLIAPLAIDKRTDPAAVVVDEAANFAVALLSGHLGGANELADQVGAVLGARPVITTAAEALGTTALDLLGRDHGWTIEDDNSLTQASAALIAGEPVGVYQDAGEEDWWRQAPRNLQRYASFDELMAADVAARLVISDRVVPAPLQNAPAGTAPVVYRPKTLVVGVGCVRGATAEEIEELIRGTLADQGLAFACVHDLATIELKRDEAGITELAARHGSPVRYFTAEELRQAAAPSGNSDVVEQAVGTPAVCEPAALLAAANSKLVVPKVRTSRVTVAVARRQSLHEGQLAVVGLGPGAAQDLTPRAREALTAADVVVGYHGYLDLVRGWLEGKALLGSPIGEEVQRCRLAVTLCREGQRVALVSSGDAGVYGTAGIVFELLDQEGDAELANRVTVVTGVTAGNAAAGRLGAPLMSDYVTLSLSDLMTPWPVIERRLRAAADGDLVVVLYNPASQRRRRQLALARELLLEQRSPSTPVGLLRNASRPGEQMHLTDLGHLLDFPVDMLTTVIIGNSATIRIGNRMVTRRGYATKWAENGAEAPTSSTGAQR